MATSPARRSLPPRPETAQRREEILRAAITTFAAKGYKGPLSDIAEQVGMTHAGVLHYFGSKSALLLEVLKFRDLEDVEDLPTQHIPGSTDLFRHLVKTAFLNARRAGIVQAFTVLSSEAVTDGHPARTFFEERYVNLRTEVADAFRAMCADEGVDAPETVEHAAAAVLAVMDGLQIQWLLDPTAVALGEASGFAIEAIVAQVLQPRTTPVSPSTENVGAVTDVL